MTENTPREGCVWNTKMETVSKSVKMFGSKRISLKFKILFLFQKIVSNHNDDDVIINLSVIQTLVS